MNGNDRVRERYYRATRLPRTKRIREVPIGDELDGEFWNVTIAPTELPF